MCDPVSLSVGLGAFGTAANMHSQQKAAKEQKKATEAASAQAAETAQKAEAAAEAATKSATDKADQANNRINAKRPDMGGVQSSIDQMAKGGQSGTLLTGPGGVDPKTLLLGRTTLLGA